jgi:hypothetical protein
MAAEVKVSQRGSLSRDCDSFRRDQHQKTFTRAVVQFQLNLATQLY